jgi:CheY-like chemotaxis protein
MTTQKLILYADDEENDVFLMRLAFKEAGIEDRLEAVTDGNQAVDYLTGAGVFGDRNKYPFPSLVLLDLKMPGKSGHSVLKFIRTQPSTCTLPVIVFTSSNQESDVHRAYLLGANGYLIKPGNPTELVTMVKGIRDYWLTQNRMPATCVNLDNEAGVSYTDDTRKP